METLFADSETFIKERPVKMTEKQSNEFYLKMAKEIIKEGWNNGDPQDIADDLTTLRSYHNGYEKAKQLEDDCYGYDIDVNFVEWLDCLDDEINNIVRANVRAWVAAHNIQPIFKKGDCLKVLYPTGSTYKGGEIIYITGIYADEATYTVWTDPDHKGGYVFAFEKIEAGCTLNS